MFWNRLTKDNSCAMEYCGENVHFLGEARSWHLSFTLSAAVPVLSWALSCCWAEHDSPWRDAVESECFAFQMGTVLAASLAIVTVQKTEFLN